MMIYVILAAGKWRRLWVEIITINFLNIHLDYASIFWEGEQRERESERRLAWLAESLLAKWHHKIASVCCFARRGQACLEVSFSSPKWGEMNCVIYCKLKHSEIRSAYPIKGSTINLLCFNSLRRIKRAPNGFPI